MRKGHTDNNKCGLKRVFTRETQPISKTELLTKVRVITKLLLRPNSKKKFLMYSKQKKFGYLHKIYFVYILLTM